MAGQKSGIIWAHDPDHRGAIIWKTSVASKQPGPQGQVNFGGSADDRNAYFGLNSGGIVALSLTNGERLWFADIDPASGRNRGQDAAVERSVNHPTNVENEPCRCCGASNSPVIRRPTPPWENDGKLPRS